MRLSRRCATPYPSLLVILVNCTPLFLPLASPSEGAANAEPEIGSLLVSFCFQMALVAGAVLATLAISAKEPVPNRLLARYSLPDDSPKAPMSFPKALGKGLLYGIYMLVIVQAATILLGLLLQHFNGTPDTQPVVQWLSTAESSNRLKLYFIIQSIAIGPIIEEFFFRFTLLPSLAASNGGIVQAVLYSTAIFTLLHGSLIGLVPLAIMSVFCSVAYLATGRIITPIVMHMLFNASSVLLIFLT